MAESKGITINWLYSKVQQEVESDTIQELNPEFFSDIAEFIGKLKKQEFDNLENKIKKTLVEMASDNITLLIKIRLEKSRKNLDFSNLLDEEKYVLDSQEEFQERADMILSAMLNGKSKLLKSISEAHKTKSITVRFLKDVDEFIGADLETYGPFKIEDLATIPYYNAQALILQEIVIRIRLDD